MYITDCAICDQPITSETECEETSMGLVCAGKCLDSVLKMEEEENDEV